MTPGLDRKQKIDHTHQLIFRGQIATVEVGGTQDVRDLNIDPQLFTDFPAKGILETLPLVNPPGYALPCSWSEIFLLRSTQE
jgi:hypothetical protein